MADLWSANNQFYCPVLPEKDCNYSAAIGMDFELRFGLDPLGKELTRWLTACQISQNFLFKIKTR